jgi:hypothetical protein
MTHSFLSNTEHLDLSSASISGLLVSDLGLLTNLSKIIISFSIPLFKTIENSQLPLLSETETLDLSANPIRGTLGPYHGLLTKLGKSCKTWHPFTHIFTTPGLIAFYPIQSILI